MLAKHLDPRILTSEVEMKPNRNGYGEGLVLAGKNNPQVIALAADLTESTRTEAFAKEFPERFVQVGITEQNMASQAAGMAAMGKIPFIASYAMFSPGRNWEQIRTTVCYNDSNVKIIGAHAGVSVGSDGATHQAIEDLAITRVIPNLTVIAPADIHEARKAVLWAAEHVGPVYIRLARNDTPVVTTPESPFNVGRGEVLYQKEVTAGASVGIIVTGTLLHTALAVAKELEEQGVGASVLHMPTIKPLDTNAITDLAKEHSFIMTVEEHQRAGGLGGAVAEHLSETYPTKIIRVGVNDEFGQSGEPEELYKEYGLDQETIISKVLNEIG